MNLALLLAPACLFLALLLGVYLWLAMTDERAAVRSSLRQLDGYNPDAARAPEQLRRQQEPLVERLVEPAQRWLVELISRVSPQGYLRTTRRKLVIAGRARPQDLDRFLGVRALTLLSVPVIVGAAVLVSGFSRLSWLVTGLLVVIAVLAPEAVLNRRITERQDAIRNRLADVLDLLTISVEAGLGFEQALDRSVSAVPGPLSEEFGRVLGESRAGASRADAMRGLEERTDVAEVRSFVLAVLQADTLGVPIGRVLRAQAEEIRIKRRQLAQERAQKAPVKMLVPMVLCIFPPLFVVVLGPAVLSLLQNLR